MGLGVSYNQMSSIDVNSLKEVTSKIFNRAAEKSGALENFDMSKFNRVSQGTDLYGSKVNAEQASNIAKMNTGFQINLSANAIKSLKYLNTQASRNAMADMTGNIALPVQEKRELKNESAVHASFGKLVSVTNLALNKKES
ncbi:MAG: hypothetical protein DKM22_07335 [Candidatus Melainabacteria bacterium]|mgnify:FL=1|nr:MAG: hypothetical protein DKM22_07335 [Candidatus Melainabacteria bacterium]